MKFKFITTLSAVAVALAISAPASFAKVYTPATYKADLAKAIGKKTGAAAYTAAASFLKLALTDAKNKPSVVTFAGLTTAALKKPVATALQVNAATSLADAVINGYFKVGTYNPKDAKFVQALTSVGKFVTLKSLKTTASANKIYAPLAKFNTAKKGSAAFALSIKQTVYASLGLPKPIS